MELPKVVDVKPVFIELEAGKTYAWCACGLSSKQPFCDGSHRPTDFTPVKFVAEESKTVKLCMCKHTKNPGFCDGSHKQL